MTSPLLVSFADGPFAPRAPVFAGQAAALGLFEDVRVHNLRTLDPQFGELHRAWIGENPRGFGYWIWKPVVVLEALRRARADQPVIYLDVGYSLNADGRRRMAEYVDIARTSPYGMLSFQNVYTESAWTKMDLAVRLGVDRSPHVLGVSQLSSGFVIMLATQSNIDLVEAWAELAVEDGYRFSDDTPSRAPNHPGFREHRHDQSIFSLLRKMRGTTVTHYEVQGYDGVFAGLKAGLPCWAERLRA